MTKPELPLAVRVFILGAIMSTDKTKEMYERMKEMLKNVNFQRPEHSPKFIEPLVLFRAPSEDSLQRSVLFITRAKARPTPPVATDGLFYMSMEMPLDRTRKRLEGAQES